jgi:hypothetical protein
MAGAGGAPWARSFQIDGDQSGHIVLKQMDSKGFQLVSTITYIGDETGLEGKLDSVIIDALRWVSLERLRDTDLTSVPLPLRWLVSNYGVHTPAALIHDWMIDEGPPVVGGLTPQYADRYFRFMLRDLKVRWIRRWMMWAAVAFRTRWKTGRRNKALLGTWVIAALAGMGAFVSGFFIGNPLVVVLAGIAPFVFALLWGRQYGAGIVASYNAPWVLPPTVVGAIGYGIYTLLEWVVSKLSRGRSGDERYGYEDF